MRGQLCTFGSGELLKKIFFYCTSPGLFLEVIDRRNRNTKHLVRLVDPQGNLVPVPEGSHFEHVASGEEVNLLENYLRAYGQQV